MLKLNFASCVVHQTHSYNPLFCELNLRYDYYLEVILSLTQNIVRACSMFHPYERYRSVTPLNYKINAMRCGASSISHKILRCGVVRLSVEQLFPTVRFRVPHKSTVFHGVP